MGYNLQNYKGKTMKTVHLYDDVHTALRLRAIHERKTLEVLTNEILSLNTNTPTAQKA